MSRGPSSQRITNNHSQHYRSDGRIEPVALLEEINEREEDAQNRRQDESDDAHLPATAGCTMRRPLRVLTQGL